MSPQKITYFKILRQQHPFLYKVCCCILFVYICLNIVRIELPPFFLFAMYSVPVENTDTQSVYEFKYNDGREWKTHEYWNHHKRMTFYYTIDFYTKSIDMDPPQAADGVKFKNWVKDNKILKAYANKVYATSDEIYSYPHWLKNNMEDILGEKISKYAVIKSQVGYKGRELEVISTDTIIHYPEMSDVRRESK